MTPKRLVTVIAAVIVVCSATVIGIYVANVGLAKIVPQGIRFVLTCLLCFSLIKGWNPGRWITVVLIGLAGIGSILGGIGLMTRSPFGILLLALGLVYVGCVVGLLTPTAKAHFVSKHQAEPLSSPRGQ
jgi:hypothetical protein